MSSHVSCSGVNFNTVSGIFFGHGNKSVSNFFCQRQKPLRSKYKILIACRRFPQNTKRFRPDARSPISLANTMSQRPLIPRRISTGSLWINTPSNSDGAFMIQNFAQNESIPRRPTLHPEAHVDEQLVPPVPAHGGRPLEQRRSSLISIPREAAYANYKMIKR